MHTSVSKLLTLFCLLSISTYLLHLGLLFHSSPCLQPAPPAPPLPPPPPPPPPPPRPLNLSILLWTWPFGRSYSLEGDPCRQMYNITGCFLSDDRSAFTAADVVVFHHHELRWAPPSSPHSLPLHLPRPPSQRWAWMSLEPPVNSGDLRPFNGLFNLTVSYRRDADVPIPYGRTVPRSAGGRPGDDDDDAASAAPVRNRSCLASWVVSRYKPTQARAEVFRRLSRRVPVEVYGLWAQKPLAADRLLPTIARCYFYLALENSNATDYISEKLWRNGLGAGAVPVVLGPSRATYEALAPRGSFIHVEDFGSVEALADHLRRVASDGEAYGKYFGWRRTQEVKTCGDWRERLCQICVRYPGLPRHKVYHDLDAWLGGPLGRHVPRSTGS
ncbi:alpha-(1,3)-fucosyltransferase 7 [Gadus macrocephalus]|uniref:alpha-(1,3)-fucosyltransferase 7 n=1 Tax=Gadus macrocephalus TaxID=80720 RepID=UPI0028CB550A|nr:alpha-(1,3)-fucosyltransferase 7 [Gadus macrocephalus]